MPGLAEWAYWNKVFSTDLGKMKNRPRVTAEDCLKGWSHEIRAGTETDNTNGKLQWFAVEKTLTSLMA